MHDLVIYHNPRCSKSRKTLEILRERDLAPRIVQYLDEPPSPKTINSLIDALGVEPHALLRAKEAAYSEVGLTPDSSREEIVSAIAAHPILLERPVVVSEGRAVIGRPPERVLELSVVADAQGGPLTADIWLDAGLSLLARSGPPALTLETLCSQLAKTRDAFAHHFASFDAYVEALLERWRLIHVRRVFDEVQTRDKRRAKLDASVLAANLDLERAIRAWAVSEPRARRALVSVDRKRLAYLERIVVARGTDRRFAELVARLEYATFVGAVQLYGDLPRAERDALGELSGEAIELLIRAR